MIDAKQKRNVRHILIDLDGVLCDFVGGALELHKRTDFNPKLNVWPPGEYDIVKVLGITDDQFWKKIDLCMAFWETLRPYPWVKSLLDACGVIAPWTICTSPSRSSRSAGGKVFWMQRQFGMNFRKYVIGPKFVGGEFAPYMRLMAAPDVLLIDDSDVNCRAFIEAGGQAIVFPQPWNLRWRELQERDPVSSVVDQLFSLFSFSFSEGSNHGKTRPKAQSREAAEEGAGKALGADARRQENPSVSAPRRSGEETPLATD